MVWVAFVLYVLGFLACTTLFSGLAMETDDVGGLVLFVCIVFWPFVIAVAAIRILLKVLFRGL